MRPQRVFVLLVTIALLGLAWSVFRQPAATRPTDTATPARAPVDIAPAADAGAATGRTAAPTAAATTTNTNVHGVVTGAQTGRPVRGGAVIAEFVDCRAHGLDAATLAQTEPDSVRRREQRQAPIAADGSYRLELPRDGLLVALAAEPADEVEVASAGQDVRFDAFLPNERSCMLPLVGIAHQLDLEVDLGVTLHGFVVEAGSGAPVPEALVVCHVEWLPFEAFGALTDTHGAFAVSGLQCDLDPAEAFVVRATAPGFLTRELRQGATHTGAVTITLARGVLLRGRVVDGAGRGLGGADVQAVVAAAGEVPLGQPLAANLQTRTAPDGTFAFTVAPCEEVVLGAWGNYEGADDEWRTGRSDRLVVDGRRDTRDLVLELRDLATFQVQAMRLDGSSVEANDLLVLRRTAHGWQREGARFFAEPAVEHELRVFAPGPAAAPTTALTAATTCLAADVHGPLTVVVVRLQPHDTPATPPLSPLQHGDDVPRSSLNAPGPHASVTLDLTFVDAQSGARLASRRLTADVGGASSSAQLSTRGVARLQLGLGTCIATFKVAGYRPCIVRLANERPGHLDAELRLHPSR